MVKNNEECMSLDGEQWKPIIGYEEYYEASDQGRIKSNRFCATRIMKLSITVCGYLQFNLYRNRKMKSFLAHRITAMTFLPDYSECLQVDHINGNRTDNRITNLRIMTNTDNCRAFNKARRNVTSQYRGVYFCKRDRLWIANIGFKDEQIYLGCFPSEIAAAKARDAKARELGFQEEGLNFPDKIES